MRYGLVSIYNIQTLKLLADGKESCKNFKTALGINSISKSNKNVPCKKTIYIQYTDQLLCGSYKFLYVSTYAIFYQIQSFRDILILFFNDASQKFILYALYCLRRRNFHRIKKYSNIIHQDTINQEILSNHIQIFILCSIIKNNLDFVDRKLFVASLFDKI